MLILNILLICLLGIIIGIMSGVTGILFTGFFILFLKYLDVGDYKTILGTTLYVTLFPITIGAVIEFYRAKKINFVAGNFLLITIAIGGYIGSKLVLNDVYTLTEKKIKYMSAILALCSSGFFFYSAYNL
jgi:uncharacterized membrane protein YfcA